MKDYLKVQQIQRAKLFAAHQKTLDIYWNDQGEFIWPKDPQAHGGYRAMLWHCLSYLSGDERCIERANRIICRNYNPQPCAFAPGAAVDVLFHHRSRLGPEALRLLHRYLELNVPFMSTEDLKIHGYNDNHPFKAMHALIVGGELLEDAPLVRIGLHRLRQAIEVYQRNGFPCEYNSPNYSPVSLNPLASIVEQSRHPEARDLAVQLERFIWQDVALHFDSRVGLPTGPMSRAYVHDYSGLLSGTLILLAHLWPERFEFDVVEEVFAKGSRSQLLDAQVEKGLPFFHAHPVWYASATYHLTEQIERAIFEKPAGTHVRGCAESGVMPMGWSTPGDKPRGAPEHHFVGPRRSLLSTWYGKAYSLGTAQYAMLDNGQACGFYVTIAREVRRTPEAAAVYYSRMFFDENYPFGETAQKSSYFREQGEIRCLQHHNTALVCCNPVPVTGVFRRLRTGIFRPLKFSRPREVYVGSTYVGHLNYLGDAMQPIAIDEGSVYVGIIPLRLTSHDCVREAHLHLHTYADHLAILMYSAEGWGPEAFSYEQIMETNAGFICEVHDADEFASFAEFREWLGKGIVEDAYYARMRTTTYQRAGLKLSVSYSPYQSAFRYASINHVALPMPTQRVEGMADPGYGLALTDHQL